MNDFKNFKAKLDEKKGLWDNIHAKRKRGEKPNPPGHPDRPTAQDFKDAQKTSEAKDGDGVNIVRDKEFKGKKLKHTPAKPGDKGFNTYDRLKGTRPAWMDREANLKKEEVAEKKLTPAEMKKREEIAKAMERDNPGMDMSKKMAIATATAKKVAEETQSDSIELDEKVYASDYNVGHEKSQFGGYRPHVTHKKTGHTMYSGSTSYKTPKHAKGHAAAYLNGYQAMGDTHADRKAREYATQNQKHQYVKESLDEGIGNNMRLISKIKKSGVVKSGSMSKDGSKPEPKKEELDITEISLDMLTKKISNSGMTTTKKANKMDKTKKDLSAMKARLAGKPALAKEAYEEEPASPDEKSMAMRQAKFIQYVGDEIMEHLEQDGDFPEWMQNKLSEFHQKAKDMHSTMSGSYEDDKEEMDEAVRRKGAPKMTGDSVAIQRAKDAELNKALGRTKTGRKKPERTMTSTQRSLASMRKEETQLDEISKKTLGSYVKKASADVASRSADNARDYARGDRPVGINKKAMKNMKRTQYVNKAVDKMTQEGVQSADKKPEKFIKPDGKIGVRMVPMDKNIVDKDK